MPTIVPILIVVVISLLLLFGIIYFVIFMNKKKDSVEVKAVSSKVHKATSDIDYNNQESIYLGIDKLKKILNQNPDDFSCREKLADLLIKTNAVQPAIKELITILDRNDNIDASTEFRILVKVADAYFNSGNLDDAYKYYVLAKRKDNSNMKVNLQLGVILVKKDVPDKALVLLRAVHTVEPSNAVALQNMCIALFKLDKYKEVINCYRILQKIKPLDDEGVFYNAASYYHIGQINEALTYFEKIRNSPDYEVQVAYYMGCIYRKRQDYSVSNEFFANATHTKKLRPAMQVEAYYQMAENYMNLSNLRMALANWESIMRLNPKYKDVANKINMYSGVRANSVLEEYLVGSTEKFANICKAFTLHYLNRNPVVKGTSSIVDMYKGEEGFIVRAEYKTKTSIEQYIFLFLRSTGIIGDVVVRTINNKMKEEKINKGVCVCCGSYSQSALDFVSSRMIDALDKDATAALLSQLHY